MEINLYKKIIKIFMSISIPDSNSKDIRQRPRVLDFVKLDGLKILTGCVPKDFLKFMVKELVDNALDKEGIKTITVEIREENGSLMLTVSDDGKGTFNREVIEKVLDFTRAPSSKHGWKIVSRGRLGNALQCCFGISYALWDDDKRPEYTVEIIGDKRYLIGLRPSNENINHVIKEVSRDRGEDDDNSNYNSGNGNINSNINNSNSNLTTSLSFRLPLYGYTPPFNMIEGISKVNPHVNIIYKDKGKEYHFNAKRDALQIDSETSIHMYTLEDFKNLVNECKDMTIIKFLTNFKGLKNREYARKILNEAGISASDGQRLSELSNEQIKELYRVMSAKTKPINPRRLPILGEEYFKSIGAKEYKLIYSKYKKKGKHKEEGVDIPYAIEFASFNSNKGIIHECINFTASDGIPFTRYVYGDKNQTLHDVIRDKGIKVLIHLVCPNIIWLDQAKRELNTIPFADDILKGVKAVSKQRYDSGFDDYELVKYTKEIMETYPNLKFTVRQIFYQLVSKHGYPNTKSAYNRLSNVLTKAREDRLVDPERIIDQSRPKYMHDPAYLTSKESIDAWFDSIINGFDLNRWDNQSVYVECWIEKDALARVIKPVCEKYRVPLIVGRGYSSYTQIYEAAKRFPRGKKVVILYLGDHDPTGLHIEENLRDRLRKEAWNVFKISAFLFIEVKRIALTTEQINRYNLHNLYSPMKKASQKAEEYYRNFGDKVWELDVLSPQVLINLLESAIKELIDWDRWNAREEEVKRYKEFIERELGVYKETLSKKIESIDNKG